MSNDFISRKDAECMIHDYFTSLVEKHIQEIDVVDCNAELQKRLDNISVAYDVRKVVEKLERCQLSNKGEYKHLNIPIVKAVDIVKEGGLNGNSSN